MSGQPNIDHTHFTKDVGTQPAAPLSEDYLKSQREAEERKEAELDAERQEHNRRTAGGGPVGG